MVIRVTLGLELFRRIYASSHQLHTVLRGASQTMRTNPILWTFSGVSITEPLLLESAPSRNSFRPRHRTYRLADTPCSTLHYLVPRRITLSPPCKSTSLR